MDISVIIPLLNEAESLPELIGWIVKVMDENKFSYEILLIDDGSADDSWTVIEQHASANSHIKGIKFRRNYGKSAALYCGFRAASGNVVITMDADLQDSPEEIPVLYKMISGENYDMVSGWKRKRHDPLFTKKLPSRFYNRTARMISGIGLHDFNCGLKAYKSRVIKSIEVYGEMHRYIPVLVKWAGFNKIGEKEVMHQERRYGTSKFGIRRFIRGPLDLLSVMFITRYGKQPLHLFGTLGMIMFLLGFVLAAYLGINKLVAIHHNLPARLVTQSPYFYIALTTMILGTQLFLTGFLGELVSRSSAERNAYQIEKEI
ncbi:MAG: glycosyltransferase family 2 protein [Bacteroidales bacterium]|nr:glycosyltransferase family 2 protein [Bacteroidales bacterium]